MRSNYPDRARATGNADRELLSLPALAPGSRRARCDTDPHITQYQKGGTTLTSCCSMIAGSSGANSTGTARDHELHPGFFNLKLRHEGT